MQRFEATNLGIGVVAAVVYLAVLRHPFVFVLAGYTLLMGTSTWVVNYVLEYANGNYEEADVDTGRVTGKLENLLILTLVLLNAYTALGLVFTAKSIIRWRDISSRDTNYYLTGTLANFTYSLLVGVGLLHVEEFIPFVPLIY